MKVRWESSASDIFDEREIPSKKLQEFLNNIQKSLDEGFLPCGGLCYNSTVRSYAILLISGVSFKDIMKQSIAKGDNNGKEEKD